MAMLAAHAAIFSEGEESSLETSTAKAASNVPEEATAASPETSAQDGVQQATAVTSARTMPPVPSVPPPPLPAAKPSTSDATKDLPSAEATTELKLQSPLPEIISPRQQAHDAYDFKVQGPHQCTFMKWRRAVAQCDHRN